MKTYIEYKISGIDWLGQIPSHWETKPFKWMFDTSTGITFTKADIVKKGNAVISYGQIHSVENTGTSVNDGLIRFIPDYIIKGKDNAVLSNGDFLFADTSEDLEGCGNCVYNDKDYPIYAGYHSIICKPLIDINGKYIAYLFKTDEWRSQIRSRVYGVKVFSITQAILAQTSLILPPLAEQQTIAAYLDDVTGKVDALITEKQKLLEDLRSYRTSLITETITRGLNPDAPLRPSGIDWLGDIPEHWISTKAKYYIEIKSGDPISKDDINLKGSVPIFGGGEIIGFTTESNIPAQTIIIGRVGARCGCVRLTDREAWATDNALVVFTSQNPEFLTRIFEAANLNRLNESNAQPLITATKIKDLGIPLPPLAEQQVIAEFLEEKTEKIDALISELEKQLEELAEYKKSVISEAVTGKVDVRDWKPQN